MKNNDTQEVKINFILSAKLAANEYSLSTNKFFRSPSHDSRELANTIKDLNTEEKIDENFATLANAMLNYIFKIASRDLNSTSDQPTFYKNYIEALYFVLLATIDKNNIAIDFKIKVGNELKSIEDVLLTYTAKENPIFKKKPLIETGNQLLFLLKHLPKDRLNTFIKDNSNNKDLIQASLKQIAWMTEEFDNIRLGEIIEKFTPSADGEANKSEILTNAFEFLIGTGMNTERLLVLVDNGADINRDSRFGTLLQQLLMSPKGSSSEITKLISKYDLDYKRGYTYSPITNACNLTAYFKAVAKKSMIKDSKTAAKVLMNSIISIGTEIQNPSATSQLFTAHLKKDLANIVIHAYEDFFKDEGDLYPLLKDFINSAEKYSHLVKIKTMINALEKRFPDKLKDDHIELGLLNHK